MLSGLGFGMRKGIQHRLIGCIAAITHFHSASRLQERVIRRMTSDFDSRQPFQ
jgi:hypothetical protein